jgi:uncharacterized protein
MIQILIAFFLTNAWAASEIKFETAKIKIGGKEIHVKVADTEARRERGLMKVTSMAVNDGMIFVFEDENILNFWMKDTLIPLSIGFFDKDGVLVDTQEMTTESVMVKKLPTYRSEKAATFAVEMNKDWFPKNKFKADAKPPLKLELIGKSPSPLLNEKLARRSSR